MAKRKPKSAGERAALILNKARKHETTARKSLDAGMEDVVVTFLFQAFENAVIAAAAVAGLVKAPTHWQRCEQATELAEQGFLETDASDRLGTLNTNRKRIAYDYEEDDDEELDLEEALEELKDYLKEVEQLINRGGKKIKDV